MRRGDVVLTELAPDPGAIQCQISLNIRHVIELIASYCVDVDQFATYGHSRSGTANRMSSQSFGTTRAPLR
jgi:hypothetical protein